MTQTDPEAAPVLDIQPDYAELQRPHVAEWFGHRVFPVVSASRTALRDQTEKRCPFLSKAFHEDRQCIKVKKDGTGPSQGVCTISTTSNGSRQDWLVCPVRALDQDLLRPIIRHLYAVAPDDEIMLTAASGLKKADVAASVIAALRQGQQRVFVYFEAKAGGEIQFKATAASPLMSLDTTVIELVAPAANSTDRMPFALGRYAAVELQTADMHGTYAKAVEALRSALDLHPAQFHRQLAENPEWPRRKIEGPNIANVFKRTFYQIVFKFQVTNQDDSAGSVLALPQPVWDSWRRFLGNPQISRNPDGTGTLLDDPSAEPRSWIYVFDVAERPGPSGGATPVEVRDRIRTDGATLARLALVVSPARAVDFEVHRGVVTTARDRLREMLPTHLKSVDTQADLLSGLD
ncbi:hypothetical protein AB0M46_33635 [Dactylosporangium sp. NPDC051485]|uniref:hypothetical protein n=1 Tax=Dactylosporangium sp. NPDC051485 TaxID=3154846 RepID=UPI003416D3F0